MKIDILVSAEIKGTWTKQISQKKEYQVPLLEILVLKPKAELPMNSNP